MPSKIYTIKRFLQGIALLHIVAGICFPLIVKSPSFGFYHEHLNQSFGIINENNGQQTLFLISIFGPTIASWGVLFLYIVNSAFSRPNAQAWWFMFSACLVWAPYDSALSILNGVYLNAVINAIAFPVIVVPLLIAKSYFNPLPVSNPE